MAKTDQDPSSPVLRNAGKQNADRLGARLVQQTEKYRQQALAYRPTTRQDTAQQEKGPAGGWDGTPIPHAPPGYTLKITFHRADNLPFADLATLSSDPYMLATLKTSLAKRHKTDPDLCIRIPTIHRNTNPTWNTEWVLANIPASGFFLKCRIFDEDPADHDDRLGNVHVRVDSITDDWQGIKEGKYKIKKRTGSKRAYLFRAGAALLSREIEMSGDVIISVENLGRTQDEDGGRAYTIGPLPWSKHFSPLIGRLTGTKEVGESSSGKPDVERYNFLAVQMQLQGPVPEDLYHRYVEFRPFVAGMFTDHSIRGRILNRALHHQHARVYNYDRSTKYGKFVEPCKEMTKLFLDFVQYDRGGRIFTYVLTLDGLFRFTETGKEFGIDLLSKHTMHSDVSQYIAFSGEFFIRRLKHPNKNKAASPDPTKEALPPAPDDDKERPQSAEDTHTKHYELVIDNDSGTYRPNAKKLHTLKSFMASNLPSLRVVTLDCQADEEKMKKLKGQQRERKKQSGQMVTYMQNSSMSSISSSEEEELANRATGVHESTYKHQLHKYVGHGEDKFHGHDHAMPHGHGSQAVNGKATEPDHAGRIVTDSANGRTDEKEHRNPNRALKVQTQGPTASLSS